MSNVVIDVPGGYHHQVPTSHGAVIFVGDENSLGTDVYLTADNDYRFVDLDLSMVDTVSNCILVSLHDQDGDAFTDWLQDRAAAWDLEVSVVLVGMDDQELPPEGAGVVLWRSWDE